MSKLINYLKLVFRPSELLDQYEAMEDALVAYKAELEDCRDKWSAELAKVEVAFDQAHHQRRHYATLVHMLNDIGYDVLPDDRGITLLPRSMDDDGKYLPFTEVH